MIQFHVLWLRKCFSIHSVFLCPLNIFFNLLFLSVQWGTHWCTVMAGEWVMNREGLTKQVSWAVCSLKYHDSK